MDIYAKYVIPGKEVPFGGSLWLYFISVVVKTFFQVSRPRPRPLLSGLETETETWALGLETKTKTFGLRSRDQDRDLYL